MQARHVATQRLFRRRTRLPRWSAPFVSLLTIALVAVGCASTPAPGVLTHGVDPSFVHGTDSGGTDRLAATVVTDVQQYWNSRFPGEFHAPWHNLDGGFFSVDTTRGDAQPPPCSGSTDEVEGNSYYCANVDAMAWDRASLLPVLREHYGDAAVLVVLAHEMGHAVQQRSGMDVGGAEHTDNPVHVETMADCYAGSYARWVQDGHSEHLRLDQGQLDRATRALIVFRDPVGGGQAPSDAHGSAFDRISAFQDGYRGGPHRCGGVSQQGPRLSTAAEPDPNRTLDDTVRSSVDSASAYFRRFVTSRGAHWTAPEFTWSDRCGTHAAVDSCGQPPTIAADRARLDTLHHDIGDQATETALASHYARAALTDLHQPIDAPPAEQRIACLTGAYTGSLAPRLSPGDLDEAVETTLTGDGIAHSDPRPTDTGFDRVGAFRAGAEHGPNTCTQ